jgi:hypothetical protein
MLKLALALLVCSVAGLRIDEAPTKSKPLCDHSSQIAEGGKWRELRTDEYKKPDHESFCRTEGAGKDSNMIYEPKSCSLPADLNQFAVKPRHVTFVGDSVTDFHAASFAWELDGNKKVSIYDKCLMEPEKMTKDLVGAGFKQDTANHTVKWLVAQASRHVMWGCKDRVSYIPLMEELPPQKAGGMLKSLMWMIKNWSPEPLGKEDAIVMNWGLHAATGNHPADWAPSLEVMLLEYKKWQTEGNAPKLIWRQVSPQHFGGEDGAYKGSLPNKCSALSQKKIEKATQKSLAKLETDRVFTRAVEAAGLKVDNVNIAILPIWQASAERHDEHPYLHDTMPGYKQGIADCTHFCQFGGVNRLWTSGVVALFDGMKKREKKLH